MFWYYIYYDFSNYVAKSLKPPIPCFTDHCFNFPEGHPIIIRNLLHSWLNNGQNSSLTFIGYLYVLLACILTSMSTILCDQICKKVSYICIYIYACDRICKNLPSTHKRHKIIMRISLRLNYYFRKTMLNIC